MLLRAESEAAVYVCPGERSPISRGIHLGRMAGFYPACRTCRHRDDTGSLSARQVKQLAETRRRSERAPLFHDEGAAGVFWNEIDPAVARRLGAALGIYLRHDRPPSAETATVVIGADGRPPGTDMVAAAGEGLRWAGCRLVDVGKASAPCLAFAVDHLTADGGLLVGNFAGQAHTVGLAFWEAAARPLSSGGSLEELRAIFDASPSRPTRRFGSTCRFSAEGAYLAGLAERYHALRPLRLVLAAQSPPVFGYLQQLTAAVACRVTPFSGGMTALGGSVVRQQAHFGALVDDDAERCRLVDDRGRPVSDERLLWVLARHRLDAQPGGVIVLEQECSPRLADQIHRRGGRVVFAGGRRAEMHGAMQAHEALLGGGASGRIWHRSGAGHASPDALWTLTLLFELLSQSDRPLADILDADAPVS